MNAPASSIAKQSQLKPGQVLLIGRCKKVRKYESRFYHLIALPADDHYSMPQLVEFESNMRRCQPDEDVTVICKVGGYPNSYKINNNGESQTIDSARNTLIGIFAD